MRLTRYQASLPRIRSMRLAFPSATRLPGFHPDSKLGSSNVRSQQPPSRIYSLAVTVNVTNGSASNLPGRYNVSATTLSIQVIERTTT